MVSLVIGGAGFLGSHLVDALIACGDKVIVVDNLSTGSLRNLEGAVTRGRVTFIYGDVTEPLDLLRKALLKATSGKLIERIFHMAALADVVDAGRDAWGILRLSTQGVLAIIELAFEHRARFTLASTSKHYSDVAWRARRALQGDAVYADDIELYIKEVERFGELAVKVAVLRRSLVGQVVRFAHCYGPRMPEASCGVLTALADGSARRLLSQPGFEALNKTSMIFVDDVVRQILHVANSNDHNFVPVDVGATDECSMEAIVETISRIKYPLPFADGAEKRSPRIPSQYSLSVRDQAKETDARSRLDKSVAQTLAWLWHGKAQYV